LSVLGRGYAIVQKKDGVIVRRGADVTVGEALRVLLAEGGFAAIVSEAEP
jgi:exonuclease VII large subunit